MSASVAVLQPDLPMRRVGWFRNLNRGGVSWWFILPAIAIYSLVLVYPMLSGAGYAFTNWNGLDPNYRYVGAANFARMRGDPQVISAISTTLLLAAALVFVKVVIGLALAVALDQQIKTRNFLRLIFFMPVVLTPVIVAFVWKYIFSTGGAANLLLEELGLGAWQQQWLGDPQLALICIIIVTAWQSVGLAMVIFLAGLQGVPKELLEAAIIDGASPTQRFFKITLPMLAPAMTVNVVIAMIQGLRLFDQIYVLTQGGPGYATETLSTIIYKISFQFAEYGYGSAIALVFAILVGAVVFTSLYFLRQREVAHG